VYIRGGRADEVGYRVEGVGGNDVLFGGSSITVSAEAVEQIQVQAGGFNAEYGGANAGIVSTQLRTGNPDRWSVSILGETDRYTGFNKNALGGWSYGYSDMTATFSGPVPGMGSKLRLFGSVQNTFYRDATLSVRAPWNFSGSNAVVTDNIPSQYHPLDGQRGDTLNIILPGGVAQGGGDNRWSFSGTALLDLSPIQFRFSGSYSFDQNQTTTVLANIFNQSRLPLNINRDGFFNVKLSHVLSPTLFYEASFNYYANTFKTMDPQFQDSFMAYGDSTANAALGYTLKGNSLNWPSYQLWGGAFTVNEAGTQVAGYEKRSQKSFGGRVDLTSQMKQHEIKVGGELTQYTIRRFNPGTAVFQWFKQQQQYSNDPATLELVMLKGSGVGTDNYGFDIFGRTLDADDIRGNSLYGLGARKPLFAAAYVQDKIELSDIILNLGLRWDYINPDSKDIPNPADIKFDGNNLLLADQLVKTAKTSQVSPRIGFSFPVSDRTVFHAQYGKFIQQTKLRDSYVSAAQMAGIIKGGFFVTGTWGWGLKPTRTTQYEAGFSQQVSDFASFDLSAFYKDIQDQITWVNVAPAAGTAGQNYGALVNADFATSKGIELKFTLRRVNRIQAQVNYTFADTRTTGSNTASTAGLWSAGSVVDPPKYTYPADFNQANRGSVLFDYRFAKGDGGPVLQQLGLNVLLTFNSGHAFTRLIQQQRAPNPGDPRFRIPVEPVGASTTPWFFQLDARLDKSFTLGPFEMNLYAYVVNLLGTDNPIDVYPRSGDPSSDGWFATPGGAVDAATYGQQYVNFYNAVNLGKNSGNWGPPRQIRFGVKLDY
jgi:outer membrane receptor protein involved in Fe transport